MNNTYNIDAEMREANLIKAIVSNPNIWPEIATIVQPQHFYITVAMQSCNGIKKCWKSDINPEQFFLDIYESLSNIEAKNWFVQVVKESPLSINHNTAKKIAHQIVESAFFRKLSNELMEMSKKINDSTYNSRELISSQLYAMYNNILNDKTESTNIIDAINRFSLVQAKNRTEGKIGYDTGFVLLKSDNIVYQRGHLWTVGGRTSVGKSAFMIESITRFFKCNLNCSAAVFSTEMTEEQNIARMLANATGIPAYIILGGKLISDHEKYVEDSKKWYGSHNIQIITNLRNLDEIVMQCRKIKMSHHGLDIVWIDYIQNITKYGKDQYSLMSEIARTLQSLAHELNCTIVCISQLSNQSARGEHDNLEFKGAGEIATASDIGIYLKSGVGEDKQSLLLEIKKNRHGRCGKYKMRYVDNFTKIDEIEKVQK